MKELSNIRGYLVFLICLVPLIHAQLAGDNWDVHSQLLQSFQNEMKNLEAAAHRVNSLLLNQNINSNAKQADQVAENTNAEPTTAPAPAPTPVEVKPKDKPFEVTVLTGPNIMHNGILNTKDPIPIASNKQTLGLSEFNPLMSFGPFGSLFNSLVGKPNFPAPWWKGKNVCVENSVKNGDEDKDREAQSEPQFVIFGTGSFERCRQTANKYICTTVISTPESTKTTTMTYECCQGYRREGNACVEVNLLPLADALEEVGAVDFSQIMTAMGVKFDRNVTVFAPVGNSKKQQALENMNNVESVRSRRAIDETLNSVNPDEGKEALIEFLEAHVTDSLLEVEDFTNEMVLNTYNNQSTLRINVYPGRLDAVITVNCVPLTSWNNLALNARIHTVEKGLSPITQSALQFLQQPRFSQFLSYLEQNDLISRIQNASTVTVFAPTNDAWQKLGDGLKMKFAQGEGCIDSILKHHILPLTLCSAPSSEGRLTTTDIAGDFLRISTNDDNEILVDRKVKIVERDWVTTNGVVHVLEDVLLPQSAKSVSDLLSYSNHTTFLGLLNKAGLTEKINKADNLTLFVPIESVLNEPETQEMLKDMDSQTLRQVLLYHAALGKNPTCDMKDDAQLDTMLEDAKLRVNMYDSVPFFSGLDTRMTVQCARLIHTDGKACHAVAHEVDRILLPPNATVLQLINDNAKLSTFRKIIEGTEIEKELEAPGSSYTVLAPSDEAFSNLDEQKLTKLLSDKSFADQAVRKHILTEPLCCSSVTASPWPFTRSVQTLQGHKVEVNRNRQNQILFGASVVTKCDTMAKDGIVHQIDKVLLPQNSRTKLGNVVFGPPGKEIMLFGI